VRWCESVNVTLDEKGMPLSAKDRQRYDSILIEIDSDLANSHIRADRKDTYC
jgi:hypothetical protein